MLEFRNYMTKFIRASDGLFYLDYDSIELMTQDIIKDYKPELLFAPQAIEYDDFIENYLGIDVDYQYLYTPSNDRIVLGCTIYGNQRIPIFDKYRMQKKYIEYNSTTVILDNELVLGSRKVQENFTGLHEAGHVWLHGNLFNDNEHIIDCYSVDVFNNKNKYSNSERNTEVHAVSDWREWQANVFAATIALPRPSLDIVVNKCTKKTAQIGKCLVCDKKIIMCEEVDKLLEELKSIYNISKEAIWYRLLKIAPI